MTHRSQFGLKISAFGSILKICTLAACIILMLVIYSDAMYHPFNSLIWANTEAFKVAIEKAVSYGPHETDTCSSSRLTEN